MRELIRAYLPCACVFGTLVFTVVGCSAIPRGPARAVPVDEASSHYKNVRFEVREIRLKNFTLPREDLERLKSSVGEAVQSHHIFSSATSDPKLMADVRVWVDKTSYHTVFFDVISLWLFPGLLAPNWGTAAVKVEVDLFNVRGRKVGEITARSREYYNATFFTYYRTAYVEDAYRKAYTNVFADVARQLSRHSEKILWAMRGDAQPASAEELELARDTLEAGVVDPRKFAAVYLVEEASPDVATQEPGPTPLPPEGPVLAPDALAQEDSPERDAVDLGTPQATMVSEEQGVKLNFGLIHEEKPPSGFWKYMAPLGGIEATRFLGRADVQSTVRDAAGNKVPVASGNATQEGYRIALYSVPRTTGFYWFPTVGYVNQRITIKDFVEELPLATETGAFDIAANCSDPSTGESRSCSEQSEYGLRMESYYAGGRIGADFVAGTENIRIFGSATGGINPAEYRTIRARLGSFRGKREGWDFARSFAGGASLGLHIPKAHIVVRLAGDYERYLKFKYNRPLEFRAAPEYDADNNVYVRSQSFTKAAELSGYTLQLGVSLVY